jgi:hypothetical protein
LSERLPAGYVGFQLPLMSNVMPLKSVAFSASEEVHWGSDIESVHFDANGLVLVVAREPMPDGQVRGLQVKFKTATAFRYLDEVEITRYWTSKGFLPGHHVLEIFEGGWSKRSLQCKAT